MKPKRYIWCKKIRFLGKLIKVVAQRLCEGPKKKKNVQISMYLYYDDEKSWTRREKNQRKFEKNGE